MSSPDAMNDAFQALARRAWESNRARAAELNDVLARWRGAGELTDEQRERGRAVAHSLRGSAGTFGHDRAADLATELEELLVATAEEPELAVVQGLIEQIDAALAAAPEVEF